eukprot:666581-Rhodomonas_salina.1
MLQEGSRPFDPFDSVVQAHRHVIREGTSAAIFQMFSLGELVGARVAGQECIMEAYTLCKMNSRAFDLVLRRHVWWDTNVPAAGIWKRLGDLRNRLYQWVFHEARLEPPEVKEEVFEETVQSGRHT